MISQKEILKEAEIRIAAGEAREIVIEDITNKHLIEYYTEVIEFKKKLNLNFDEESNHIITLRDGNKQ